MSRRTPRRLAVHPGARGVTQVAEAMRGILEDGAGPVAVSPVLDSSAQQAAALAAALREDVPIERDEVAVVLATSGSTGEPQGVLLSRSALIASADLGARALGPPGLWLTAVPVTGIGGLLSVVRSLRAGLTPVPLPSVGGAERFEAEHFVGTAEQALRRADEAGVPGYVSLVPTQLRRLLAVPDRASEVLTGFHAVLVGGAALGAQQREDALRLGIALVESYGSTETCGGVVYDGLPLTGVGVSIVDPETAAPAGFGRIVVSGPTLALGYRLRPDLTAAAFRADGFHTSDAGWLVEGQLVVSSRLDNIVKVGAVKVSLGAVTHCLLLHPRVIDAVVSARSDPEWGSVPVAYVVTDATPTDSDGLAVELSDRVADSLGRASRPRRIVFVDHLPTTHTGKPRPPAED